MSSCPTCGQEMSGTGPSHIHTCLNEKGQSHTWPCSSPYCQSKVRPCTDHGGTRPRSDD
jgi:hypothetical protein